ncbi:MAG: hypothetical protein WAM72_19210, partial [Xanthobacteraceae bacterium]
QLPGLYLSGCRARMVDLMSLDPSCGGKGATLQRPGWAGYHIGFYPFPTDIGEPKAQHGKL